MFAFYLVASLMLVSSALARSVDKSFNKRETRWVTQNMQQQCEGSQIELECRGSAKITVTSSNYGRLNRNECQVVKMIGEEDDGLTNDICYQDVTEAFAECNGESSCVVEVSEDNLGNDCNHVNKYLVVIYSCHETSLF